MDERGSIPQVLPRWPKAARATSSRALLPACLPRTPRIGNLRYSRRSTCMDSRAKGPLGRSSNDVCLRPRSWTIYRRPCVSARLYRTSSEEDTIDLGRKLATELTRPVLVLLIGKLGAGKTTLAKGIVAGLGATTID